MSSASIQNTTALIQKLPKYIKPVAKYLQKQEIKGASLANARFIQDTATNFAPKAVFSRSLADFADMGFLEILESMLVYYCPTVIGEKIFRKAYSHNLNSDLAKKVSKPLIELAGDKSLSDKALREIKPVKAAIALSSMLIPLSEFTLNYFKNLFTLKVFNQADFDNIANLSKEKKEDTKKQERVKKSAIKNIKRAAGAFALCSAASVLIAKKGKDSKAIQKFSDLILAPGSTLFKSNKKAQNFVNKYFSLDFADNNGKLGLGHGQLTSCVLIGGLGYFGASKDRGKQNFLETAFRYPLVGFYVITGSELFEKGFKKLLQNKKGFKELIDKNLNVAKFSKLPEIAENLAKLNNGDTQKEFAKLVSKKALISAVPFIFSIGFMGLFVAGVSRFFTQYRYNKEHNKCEEKGKESTQNLPSVDIETFKNNSKLMNNPFQKIQY